jgi:hypothetical protein
MYHPIPETLHFANTNYLCVPCESHNKQLIAIFRMMTVAGSYEYYNELSGSLTCGEFLLKLSDCKLVKYNYAQQNHSSDEVGQVTRDNIFQICMYSRPLSYTRGRLLTNVRM